MKYARLLTTALLTISLSAIPLHAQYTPPPPLKHGILAPGLSAKLLNGQTLTLKSLRGRVVLLDFWATWCGPCRMAVPTLESLHTKFQPKGFTVVGISIDDDASIADVRPFVQKYGITYPIAAAPDGNVRLVEAYNAAITPSQYLIDKRGRVRWCQSGYTLDEGQVLKALIKKLLAEKG